MNLNESLKKFELGAQDTPILRPLEIWNIRGKCGQKKWINHCSLFVFLNIYSHTQIYTEKNISEPISPYDLDCNLQNQNGSICGL